MGMAGRPLLSDRNAIATGLPRVTGDLPDPGPRRARVTMPNAYGFNAPAFMTRKPPAGNR
jgi:hypothetical protein